MSSRTTTARTMVTMAGMTGEDDNNRKDEDSKDNGDNGKDDNNDGGNGDSDGSGGGKIGGEVSGVARSVAWLGDVVVAWRLHTAGIVQTCFGINLLWSKLEKNLFGMAGHVQ
jgi:hypothetical protein